MRGTMSEKMSPTIEHPYAASMNDVTDDEQREKRRLVQHRYNTSIKGRLAKRRHDAKRAVTPERREDNRFYDAKRRQR